MKYINTKTGITVEYDGDISGNNWKKLIEFQSEELPVEKTSDSKEKDEEPKKDKVITKKPNKKSKATKGKTVIKP